MLLHILLKYYKVVMEVYRFGFQQQATIVLDDTCVIHKTSMHGLWEAKYLDIACGCQTLPYLWNSHPVKQPGFTA